MRLFKIVLLMFTFCVYALYSQNNLKTINGLLVDEVSNKQISFASVIVSKTGEGVLTNELGRFRLKVLPEDSLTIQVINYEQVKLSIPDSLLDQGQLFVIKLKPVQYEIDEVNITSDKKVPTELKSDVFQEKPKFYVAFFRPISYVYYHTNKKERKKRQLIDIKAQEELINTFAHVYNRETIAEYSMLEDLELDKCIMFCNSNINLSYQDSDDDVRRKLITIISDYFNLNTDDIN